MEEQISSSSFNLRKMPPLRMGEGSTTTTIKPPLSSKEEIRQLLLKEANYDCDSKECNSQNKRKEYLSWDDYFVGVAFLSAHRSKDPKEPKGACIVDDSNRVIGIGYNGFPYGCSDDMLPWKNDTHTPFLHTPIPYECHAEMNAILNKCSADVVGARMYVGQFPNNECAKIIIQSGIKEVIYIMDKDPDADIYRASRILFQMGGVTVRQYKPSVDTIELDLSLPSSYDSTKQRQQNNDNDSSITASSNQSKKRKIMNDKDETEFRNLLLHEANYVPPAQSTKRRDYLSWDDYFMALAFLTAKRSKDPNTQVGACIVNSTTRRVLACGYNGFPRGCSDDYLPWGRKADLFLHKKYPYVCHAEVNAILNKGSADVKDSTLYVALYPCNECAKMIIQAGIKEVVYMQDHYHNTDMCRASRIMFSMAGVKVRQHVPSISSVTLDLKAGLNVTKEKI